MDNQEWTMQRNRQHWVHKTKANKTINTTHHYTQANRYNVNKVGALLQTAEGKSIF